jgi:glutathione S-transferase
MKIALYYAPNTCALAPYVTLTEAGADFEVRSLNFRKRQNFSPDYLKINPKHKVPALVVDGKILTENVAIHQWVHRTFPDAKILPADPWDQLQAISLHGWCASGIHPFLSRINNPPKVCDATGASDSVMKFATETLFENFRIGDDMLAGREYFFDHFTAPGRTFLLVLPPRQPVGGGHLGLPQRRRAFPAHAGATERQEARRLRERSE